MKSPYQYLFFLSFLLVFSSTYAETKNPLVNSIYFIELLIMGGISLALIFIFILMLNERGHRVKKMTLVYEELDQKMSVMQMMMNSVREKEKNIIKIVQEQVKNIDKYSVAPSHSHLLEIEGESDNKNDVVVDSRTLDANGRVKQSHLSRENYLIAMRDAHSKGLSDVVSIDNTLQEAIESAVNQSDCNLQKIDSFYQKVSELIDALKLDDKSGAIKPSSQDMIRVLSDIQCGFEELLKQQKYNQSSYEGLSRVLIEKPYNYPTDIVTAVLEK
jgi:hypothetical protein